MTLCPLSATNTDIPLLYTSTKNTLISSHTNTLLNQLFSPDHKSSHLLINIMTMKFVWIRNCCTMLHNHSQSEDVWCLMYRYTERGFGPMRFHCGRGCLIQCCKNRNQVINKIVLPQLQLVRTKAQVYMLESFHRLSQYHMDPTEDTV